MLMVKRRIYQILKGGFLTSETSFKNWRLIIFVVLLLLIMISSSHSSDQKVMKISGLNELKRELRAEYIDTETILMRMMMESSIRNKTKDIGLKPAKTPPKRIIIKKE